MEEKDLGEFQEIFDNFKKRQDKKLKKKIRNMKIREFLIYPILLLVYFCVLMMIISNTIFLLIATAINPKLNSSEIISNFTAKIEGWGNWLFEKKSRFILWDNSFKESK